MDRVIIKPREIYEIVDDDAKPNFLYTEYLEPIIDTIKLEVREETAKTENYVANRFGISPRIKYSRRKSRKYNEKLAQKISSILAPHIEGETEQFDLRKSPEYKIVDIILRSRSGFITFLHGDIGTGKTTLLRFLRDVVFENIPDVTVTLYYIDALTAVRGKGVNSLSAEDLKIAVVAELEKSLLDPFDEVEEDFMNELATEGTDAWNTMKEYGFSDHLQIFRRYNKNGDFEGFQREFNEFDKQSIGKPYRFQYSLVKLMYLKKLNNRRNRKLQEVGAPFKKLCLVFDNIDRTSRETKKEIIDVAKWFSEILCAPVILTLRSRELNRIINAFDREIGEIEKCHYIELQPPDIGYILKKRYDACLKPIKNTKMRYRGKYFMFKEGLNEVLSKLSNLLLEKKSKELLLSIHNGNIRRTANNFIDLLSSPTSVLPIERLIQNLYDRSIRYPFIRNRLPFDYLLEMVALNGKVLYRRNTSLLTNVYCCNNRLSKSNIIIKSRVFRYLMFRHEDGDLDIEVDEIINHLNSIFKYPKEDTYCAINQLLKDGILWSKEGLKLNGNGDKKNGIPVKEIQLRTPFHTYNKIRKFLWYICLVKEDCLMSKKKAHKISFKSFDKKKGDHDRYNREIKHALNFVEILKNLELEEIRSIGQDSFRKDKFLSYYGLNMISVEIIDTIRKYFIKKELLIKNSLNRNDEYDLILDRLKKMEKSALTNAGTILN